MEPQIHFGSYFLAVLRKSEISGLNATHFQILAGLGFAEEFN